MLTNTDFIKKYLLLRQNKTRNKSVSEYISLKEKTSSHVLCWLLLKIIFIKMVTWRSKGIFSKTCGVQIVHNENISQRDTHIKTQILGKYHYFWINPHPLQGTIAWWQKYKYIYYKISLANFAITFLTRSVPDGDTFHLNLNFNWKPCPPLETFDQGVNPSPCPCRLVK